MFTKLKYDLTGKFVLLSVSVYVILSVLAAYVFHHGLTHALDEQLEEIKTVIMPTIKLTDLGKLSFRDPPKTQLEVSNLLLSPSISLFDSKKELIAAHGEQGSKLLMPSGTEVKVDGDGLRSLSAEIDSAGQKVGYVQIQLTTSHREHAVRELLLAIFSTAPILLVCLAGAGFLFASRAIKPIEDTFSLLKRFMSDAGHELKTPIAVIHATCDNLAADLEGNKAACERVDVISRSADRMQRLVSDLLLLTKSEQSAIALKMVPLRLDMLLREVLGEFGDLFEEKGIELQAPHILNAKINGDKDALHRMLANLLENALNYTNSGGKVTVSLSLLGSNLIVKISDTGIGIPPESIDKVFERFFRVDESRSRAAGGAGLGLAIVRAIAESHNGHIAVSSELGVGTTFTITLPAVGMTTIFGHKIELEKQT